MRNTTLYGPLCYGYRYDYAGVLWYYRSTAMDYQYYYGCTTGSGGLRIGAQADQAARALERGIRRPAHWGAGEAAGQ